MSQSICLRCLTRSLNDIQQPIQRIAFSTSARVQVNPPKKKVAVQGTKQGVKRGSSQLRLKKNVRVSTGKPPTTGERRALRKRIVLSNPNALEVQGLSQLDQASLRSLEKMKGRVVSFNDKAIDTLRALQAFKTTQKFWLFRVPSTVIREETVKLAKAMEEAEQSKEASSIILTGARGSGKSVLQLQAMSIAKSKGWILIHFPDGQELVNANTAFQPSKGANGKTIYLQPYYTAQLLQQVLAANQAILSEMQLRKKHDLPIPVPDDISLARMLELGSRDPSIACSIWDAFMEELSAPSSAGKGLQRPPVMVSMDELNHIMKLSNYVDAELKPVHAHELALVRCFTDRLNGSVKLPNGGLVLGSTTASNCPLTPTLNHILETKIKSAAKQKSPKWDPYATIDTLVERAVATSQVHELGGLSKPEAKVLMQYFASSGIYRDEVTDALVAEKWSINGGGIIGELEKSCVRQKF